MWVFSKGNIGAKDVVNCRLCRRDVLFGLVKNNFPQGESLFVFAVIKHNLCIVNIAYIGNYSGVFGDNFACTVDLIA